MTNPATPPPAPAAGRPSPLGLVALVVANLVPLVGVGWLGWSLIQVLLLYWVESGIIGLFNVLRILLAQGGPLDRPSESPPFGSRVAVAGFFCLHYGGFWLGHLLLILVVFNDQPFSTGADGASPSFAVSGSVLLVSHAAAFLFDYVGRGAYRTASPELLMWLPYVRVFTAYLGAFGGGALLARFGAPVWGLVVLVAVKLLAEVGLYLAGYSGSTGAARTGQRAAAPTAGGW